jgi:hypothetical protein
MPVAFDRSTIEAMEDLLKLGGGERGITVAPNSDGAAWSDDTFGFAKKCICVEPVKRLRDCYKIDRFLWEPARLRRGNSIFDVESGFGLS